MHIFIMLYNLQNTFIYFTSCKDHTTQWGRHYFANFTDNRNRAVKWYISDIPTKSGMSGNRI